MENNEEVFVDAEEEVTPRRPGRKRRSTAGSCSSYKKARGGARRMPLERSPKKAAADTPAGNPQNAPPPGAAAASGDLLAQMQQMMGGMLGGLETRLGRANDELQATVKCQLGQAMTSIDKLNGRMSETEKRMDKVEDLIEKGIAEGFKKMGLPGPDPGQEFPALVGGQHSTCLLYTSPSPRDRQKSRMPSSA